ncbi:hypothetical protein HMPREF0083_01091 [Aneurinibacillus aneurinilyticus ATCC 12856]|uniref:Uncharacterized protein n=1 Tax=Aneurinibacillus aneurinilyticus ATCC 12856 TaxID=649747 RepID=U1X798_ANEAE|nr:hypothetical protein HMPREF0083_01091 [Aneurinibacillus aneurinilyticus ATCC 12856]
MGIDIGIIKGNRIMDTKRGIMITPHDYLPCFPFVIPLYRRQIP